MQVVEYRTQLETDFKGSLNRKVPDDSVQVVF